MSSTYGTLRDTQAMNEGQESLRLLDNDPLEDPEVSPHTAQFLATELEEHEEQHHVLEGISKAEAISASWSRKSLVIAYSGLYLTSFIVSLEQQTTFSLQRFATSNFAAHSNLATINLFGNIFLAVAKPPMVKAGDVFGRTEALFGAVTLYLISYILLAISQNFSQFMVASMLYMCGQTGLFIMNQLIIADTSSLINRGLLSALPDLPYLFTVWLGPAIAQALHPEKNNGWRWGYGMWAFILPLASFPLLLSLYTNQQLDGTGIILFLLGFCLVLYPLSRFGLSTGVFGISKHDLILMSLGVAGVLLLFWYECVYAEYPIFALRSLIHPTIMGSCFLLFFSFVSFYLFQNFLTSYLQVSLYYDVDRAGIASNIYSFSSTTTGILSGLVMKRLGRYRALLFTGIPLYALGVLLMYAQGFFSPIAPYAIFIGLFMAGLGGGLMVISAQVAVQSVSEHCTLGANLALYLTFSSIGGAFGSALAKGMWTKNLSNGLLTLLNPYLSTDEIDKIFHDLRVALSYVPGTHIRELINTAFAQAQRLLTGWAVVTTLLMFVSASFIQDKSLSQPSPELHPETALSHHSSR
ncbi:siderophore-iron transporter Str2 [Schizosaccharomyces japonicus yFS275]|uniref:Siderophore-iron transporter Str2 n=1 Tax=Schizosaccharomyces japonicus (strain yFS275 / FY16936) TaxID=402676 RepID=B6K4V3_SCHJY|nr:siderophore-iron transporter Str2 [Schizosaccharomyces japonicus yFS275]EEB08510.1 siderophore-iron transporter Str2 [Schizosaccharomyces japonicus yFS275]